MHNKFDKTYDDIIKECQELNIIDENKILDFIGNKVKEAKKAVSDFFKSPEIGNFLNPFKELMQVAGFKLVDSKSGILYRVTFKNSDENDEIFQTIAIKFSMQHTSSGEAGINGDVQGRVPAKVFYKLGNSQAVSRNVEFDVKKDTDVDNISKKIEAELRKLGCNEKLDEGLKAKSINKKKESTSESKPEPAPTSNDSTNKSESSVGSDKISALKKENKEYKQKIENIVDKINQLTSNDNNNSLKKYFESGDKKVREKSYNELLSRLHNIIRDCINDENK